MHIGKRVTVESRNSWAEEEQPTPLNMSQREFRERAESNGATTRNLSASEWRKDLENYKKDRKETNDFLNQNEFNRTAKKDT